MLVLLFAAACTDPRGRPVPPTITLHLDSGLVVTSPGPLTGSLIVSDPTGIDSIRVTLTLGNGTAVGDSTFFASNDPFTDTLPLFWQVPGAIPRTTGVKLLARVRSFIGFTAADSLLTAVGDTLR